MHVALIGTRGVPARYGGFETCVEEVGARLATRGLSVSVYCREKIGLTSYEGIERIELPALRNRSLETLSHSALSVAHAISRSRRLDAAIVFNAANSPFLPFLRARGIPTALHMDGLEWKRSKWGHVGRRYYRYAEAAGVFLADEIISDADGIAQYYKERYGVSSNMIAYGASIVGPSVDRLDAYRLQPRGYSLIVARFEPENHVLEAIVGALEGTVNDPVVVVGSTPYPTAYSEQIKKLASNPRVRLLGGIWDQAQLDALYASCKVYIHGHSVGGTNPSLLRAMGAAAPTAAFDVGFNRETLANSGLFWTSPATLAGVLRKFDSRNSAELGIHAQERVRTVYNWGDVTDKYEEMLNNLVNTGKRNVFSGGSLNMCVRNAWAARHEGDVSTESFLSQSGGTARFASTNNVDCVSG